MPGNIYETLLMRNLNKGAQENALVREQDVLHARVARDLGEQQHQQRMHQLGEDRARAALLGELRKSLGMSAPNVGGGAVGEAAEMGGMKAAVAQQQAAAKALQAQTLEKIKNEGKVSLEELKGIDRFNLEAYVQEQINARAKDRAELEAKLFGPGGARRTQYDYRKTKGALKLNAAIKELQSLEDRLAKRPWDSALRAEYDAKMKLVGYLRSLPGEGSLEGPPDVPGEGASSGRREELRARLKREGKL